MDVKIKSRINYPRQLIGRNMYKGVPTFRIRQVGNKLRFERLAVRITCPNRDFMCSQRGNARKAWLPLLDKFHYCNLKYLIPTEYIVGFGRLGRYIKHSLFTNYHRIVYPVRILINFIPVGFYYYLVISERARVTLTRINKMPKGFQFHMWIVLLRTRTTLSGRYRGGPLFYAQVESIIDFGEVSNFQAYPHLHPDRGPTAEAPRNISPYWPPSILTPPPL